MRHIPTTTKFQRVCVLAGGDSVGGFWHTPHAFPLFATPLGTAPLHMRSILCREQERYSKMYVSAGEYGVGGLRRRPTCISCFCFVAWKTVDEKNTSEIVCWQVETASEGSGAPHMPLRMKEPDDSRYALNPFFLQTKTRSKHLCWQSSRRHRRVLARSHSFH